jgi:hypothetical protein
VQKGDDVPVDFSAEQVVSPVREGQVSVEFKLYRMSFRLPPLDATTLRSFVLTEAARGVPLQANYVSEQSVAAKISVNVGGGSMSSTRATVSLFFGRTEVRCEAKSTLGDKKQVSLQWKN